MLFEHEFVCLFSVRYTVNLYCTETIFIFENLSKVIKNLSIELKLANSNKKLYTEQNKQQESKNNHVGIPQSKYNYCTS